jgi:hypothetical protein
VRAADGEAFAMRQYLHLLVVDRRRRMALTAAYGTRWLLPMVYGADRARAGPLALRWAAERGLGGEVVGQWLGRVMPDGATVDWLIVIASDDRTNVAPGTNWTPLRMLKSSPSLLDYQQWAMRMATSNTALPSVPGPFGALTWLDEIKRWVATVLGIPDIGPVCPHRTTANEVVLEISADRSLLFFKGLTWDRDIEPRVTAALASMAPESFARTIALDRQADGSIRWLSEACPGSVLSRRWSLGAATRVVRACAQIQQQAIASAVVERTLPAVDLPGAFEWALQWIDRAPASIDAGAARKAIERVRDELPGMPAPDSWIPMDLDPENVLVDDDGAVRFIDLDDSYFGPAPLAIAAFARRIRRSRIAAHDEITLKRAVYGAYEEAWPHGRPCPWSSVEIASIVIDAYLAWRRILRSEQQGDISGAVEVTQSRVGQELADAICRSQIT